MRRHPLAIVSVALLLTVVAGCSSSADKHAEQVIQDRTGSSVKIDTKNGNFSVSGKNGSASASVGSKAKLPDGWPRDLKAPAGTDIKASSTITKDGKAVMTVVAQVPGSVKDVYNGLKSQLTGAGYSLSEDHYGSAAGVGYAQVSGKNGTYSATATMGALGSSKTTVTFVVAQDTSSDSPPDNTSN